MNAIIGFIKREPAILMSIVLAAANVFWTLNADQVLAVETIVESLLVLLGGSVVRSAVTPVVKLEGK